MSIFVIFYVYFLLSFFFQFGMFFCKILEPINSVLLQETRFILSFENSQLKLIIVFYIFENCINGLPRAIRPYRTVQLQLYSPTVLYSPMALYGPIPGPQDRIGPSKTFNLLFNIFYVILDDDNLKNIVAFESCTK